MMFTGITISFGLVALACGIALLIWAMRNEGKGVSLAKLFGYVISMVAFLVIVVTIFLSAFESFGMKKMMKNGCPMCKMMQDRTSDMNGKSMMDEKRMHENTKSSRVAKPQ